MEATVHRRMTMDGPRIPIRNLYYLLCYAWNQLPQGDIVDVSRVPSNQLVDLFALVLCDGVQHLARRGLEQGYEQHEEEVAGVRGRIDLMKSSRRFLPLHGRAACVFDQLTANTLANQILKSTLRRLEMAVGLDASLRKRVHALGRDMRDIDQIRLTTLSFRKVQIHSNNRFYKFLINVCEFVHGAWLVDPATGSYRFWDFVRDERAMARVFQKFVFNFIRIEMPQWKAKTEHMQWCATSTSDPNLAMLPRMETDVSMIRGNDFKIIDAKYYQDMFARRFDAEKFHSAHIFQIFSYLANASASGRLPAGVRLQGVLLYPCVDRTVRAEYTILGYPVTIATIDLAQPWELLRQEIIDLIA